MNKYLKGFLIFISAVALSILLWISILWNIHEFKRFWGWVTSIF